MRGWQPALPGLQPAWLLPLCQDHAERSKNQTLNAKKSREMSPGRCPKPSWPSCKVDRLRRLRAGTSQPAATARHCGLRSSKGCCVPQRRGGAE